MRPLVIDMTETYLKMVAVCERARHDCVEILKRVGRHKDADLILQMRIQFEKRSTRRLGVAYPFQNLIGLSWRILQQNDFPVAELRDTVIHEIAHILTPGHGHNQVWKLTAKLLRGTGDRCHFLPTVPKGKDYICSEGCKTRFIGKPFYCICGNHEITRVKYKMADKALIHAISQKVAAMNAAKIRRQP